MHRKVCCILIPVLFYVWLTWLQKVETASEDFSYTRNKLLRKKNCQRRRLVKNLGQTKVCFWRTKRLEQVRRVFYSSFYFLFHDVVGDDDDDYDDDNDDDDDDGDDKEYGSDDIRKKIVLWLEAVTFKRFFNGTFRLSGKPFYSAAITLFKIFSVLKVKFRCLDHIIALGALVKLVLKIAHLNKCFLVTQL